MPRFKGMGILYAAYRYVIGTGRAVDIATRYGLKFWSSTNFPFSTTLQTGTRPYPASRTVSKPRLFTGIKMAGGWR